MGQQQDQDFSVYSLEPTEAQVQEHLRPNGYGYADRIEAKRTARRRILQDFVGTMDTATMSPTERRLHALLHHVIHHFI